jgi:hypothetical protein
MPIFPSRPARRAAGALVTSAIALALAPSSAPAARTPLRACGDTTAAGGVLIDDISSRRVTCKEARRVARMTPRRCGNQGTCTVRGFSCITARALEELRFARCSKAGHGNELYRVIRFDFGS